VTPADPQSPPAAGSRGADRPPGPPPDEFAGIPSNPGRHPVVAAGVVALAGFLIFQMRGDIRYALSSAEPQDIGQARTLASAPPDAVPANRLVRLAGSADRESAVILDTRGSWDFTQFFRVLGTGNRVFVHRRHDPLPVELAERDVFTGRLIRFRDLSFQDSIRRHFSSQVTATHFFKPEDLKGALASGGAAASLQVADRLGEKVTLGADDRLAIDVARPGEIRIEIPAARARDAAAARALVEQQGGQVVSAATAPTPASARQVVVARFPEGARDRALAALTDLDRLVKIGPARTTVQVRVRDLKAEGEGFQTGAPGGAVVPLADVAAVRSLETITIPDDAWLLVEGSRPRDHLKTLLAAVFLAGFAVFNLLALRRFA
jgi:hypothetical protein